MPLLTLEEMLKEIEDNSIFHSNCTNGEEYEEWLRTDITKMRKFTPEELIEYKESLKQIYKPTGRKLL